MLQLPAPPLSAPVQLWPPALTATLPLGARKPGALALTLNWTVTAWPIGEADSTYRKKYEGLWKAR